MDEMRKDPTRGQWVLVRPKAKAVADGECPYCPGRESLNGPEIAAYRTEGGAADGPGWRVRVLPESDPYFRIEWELVREGVGMFDMITPRGASELILESPRHDDTLATMEPAQIESVLWMYRDRLIDLKRDNQIRDILITPPSEAGRATPPSVLAGDGHPHRVRRDAERAARGARVLPVQAALPLLRHAPAGDGGRRAHRPGHSPFIALVPYAARGPLEVWIVPRQHGCSYEEGLTADTASALAELLSQLFRALEQGFGDPGYEMVLHTAPNLKSRILQGDWATIRDDYHWHIEIAAVPERVNRVGGIYVNETPPEAAAAELRQAWRTVAAGQG